MWPRSLCKGSEEWKTNTIQNGTEADNHQHTNLDALTPLAPTVESVRLVSHWYFI